MSPVFSSSQSFAQRESSLLITLNDHATCGLRKHFDDYRLPLDLLTAAFMGTVLSVVAFIFPLFRFVLDAKVEKEIQIDPITRPQKIKIKKSFKKNN